MNIYISVCLPTPLSHMYTLNKLFALLHINSTHNFFPHVIYTYMSFYTYPPPPGVSLGDSSISMTTRKQVGPLDLLNSASSSSATDSGGMMRDSVGSSTEMLWGWLQCRLRRALSKLVLDFVKDDTGALWLLQVWCNAS
jgi:hypothetical protein